MGRISVCEKLAKSKNVTCIIYTTSLESRTIVKKNRKRKTFFFFENWEKKFFGLFFCRRWCKTQNWTTLLSILFTQCRLQKNKQTIKKKKEKKSSCRVQLDIKIYENFEDAVCFYQTIIIDINDSRVWKGTLESDSQASLDGQKSRNKEWKKRKKVIICFHFPFLVSPASPSEHKSHSREKNHKDRKQTYENSIENHFMLYNRQIINY